MINDQVSQGRNNLTADLYDWLCNVQTAISDSSLKVPVFSGSGLSFKLRALAWNGLKSWNHPVAYFVLISVVFELEYFFGCIHCWFVVAYTETKALRLYWEYFNVWLSRCMNPRWDQMLSEESHRQIQGGPGGPGPSIGLNISMKKWLPSIFP